MDFDEKIIINDEKVAQFSGQFLYLECLRRHNTVCFNEKRQPIIKDTLIFLLGSAENVHFDHIKMDSLAVAKKNKVYQRFDLSTL